MKVLIVSSGNSGKIAPFVKEQADALARLNVRIEYFLIVGKGVTGYLSNLSSLKAKINIFRPDLIHAHYGLAGLLALLVKSGFPLLTTFHGNDVNSIHPNNPFRPNWNKILSKIVYAFGSYSIFVTEEIARKVKANPAKSEVIPCHVDLCTFHPIDKYLARKRMNLSKKIQYILFCSAFDTPIKNFPLAKVACSGLENYELLELKGYTREEVNLLLNASDVALITSFNEGSNQFIKEAMACNCPIVSTRVGDAEWIIGSTEGCYFSSFDEVNVTTCLQKALHFSRTTGRTEGRQKILELMLDTENISNKILEVYKKVAKKCVESVD